MVATLEGVVEHGQIRLLSSVRLPEQARVFVVVPGLWLERTASVRSPHLARPEQLSDFALEVTEEEA